MKATFFCFLVWSTLLAGCAVENREPAELLLQDPKMQEKIFDVILADSTYLESLLEKMNPDPGLNNMHGRMMKRMFHAVGLDSIMMADTVFSVRALSNM
jgi:hypothetical protein